MQSEVKINLSSLRDFADELKNTALPSLSQDKLSNFQDHK